MARWKTGKSQVLALTDGGSVGCSAPGLSLSAIQLLCFRLEIQTASFCFRALPICHSVTLLQARDTNSFLPQPRLTRRPLSTGCHFPRLSGSLLQLLEREGLQRPLKTSSLIVRSIP